MSVGTAATRWGPIVPVITLVILALLAGAGAIHAAAQDQPEETWTLLGPGGAVIGGPVAVSPGWPNDKLILVGLTHPFAMRGGTEPEPLYTAARSFDGGQTWEALAGRLPASITMALLPDGRRVLFAVGNGEGNNPDRGIFRSTDDGASWVPVLWQEESPRWSLVLSPAFAQDGLAFAYAEGQAWRSTDYGATWAPCEPVPGQRVEQIAVSPDVASDGTIFAAIVNGEATPTGNLLTDEEMDRVSASAGIARSVDRGATWTPVVTGLEHGGIPFRYARGVTISPAFAADGTVFAQVWGRCEAGSRQSRQLLFRSRDRGDSWEEVWQPGQPDQQCRPVQGPLDRLAFELILAPSPLLATNGIILAAEQSGAGMSGTATCRLVRSLDAGATWEEIQPPRPGVHRRSCFGLGLYGADGLTAVWTAAVQERSSISVSRDAGTTVVRATLPSSWGLPYPDPVVTPDGTVFVGERGGIWMLDRSPPPAPAAQPSPSPDAP